MLACYGMRNPKAVDDRAILKQAKKYHIPESDSYVLDSAYKFYLKSLITSTNQESIKNHMQPLQALYFDSNHNLVSFQVNCYAGGFPNLKWNRNEMMGTFPPGQQAPLDTLLSLEKLLTLMHPIAGVPYTNTHTDDYVVVVFWTKFMGRQSKRLIRYVQQNRQLAPGKKIKIVYVNADNQFLEN
jgi:hypothetical protein